MAIGYEHLVTAIVSTYNSERFIGGCLEDLERQSIADQLEIIVVISGSQQAEEKIVNEFCKKYSNIRVIKTAVRETVYQAWNRAIKIARGKYLTNANTDDRHRADAFEKMVIVLEEDPSTALVYVDQKYFRETNDQSKEFMFDRDRGPFSRTRLLDECFVGSQPMWRASVHKEYGYFDEAFFTAGDYEFWLRITQSHKFAHLKELLGERLIRSDSLEYDGNSQLSYFESAIIRKCYEYAETYRIPINRFGLGQHPLFLTWCELNLIRANTLSKISAKLNDPRTAARNVYDNRSTGNTPRLSVVITTFNRKDDLIQNLRALNSQICKNFEAIIVNNGVSINELSNGQLELAYSYCYLENPSNYGPSHARNLGVRNARSDIVAILDDDAIADPGWVLNILKHFDEEPISALRGRVRPKSLEGPVHIPVNYDLGDAVIFNTAGLEMNTAFRRKLFLELGGYDEFMFGYEGAELSYRIFMACHKQVECIKYYPDVTIFHDFPDNPERLFETQLRLKFMKQLAHRKLPGISEYISVMWGIIPANQQKDNYSYLVENAIFCFYGSPQKSASFAAKAIAVNHSEPLGFVLLGSALLKLGKYVKARKYFEIALPLIDHLLKYSSMKTPIKESRLQLRSLLLHSMAQCLEKEGNFERAKQVRKQADKPISVNARRTSSPKSTYDPLLQSKERLLEYKQSHQQQRCVIIGNGPSLTKMDLSFLENEISFGMNRIYLMFDKWNFRPSYYVSVNPLVLEQSAEEILKIKAPKLISHKGIPFFPNPPSDLIFIRSLPDWVFSNDPRIGLCEGWTVTYFAMQLAYYMGFEEVVLIGVDHHFTTKGDPNKEVLSEGDDPDHFNPGYFGKGVRWHLPDLTRSEQSYRMAKMAFERDGRRILDATVDGRLTVFPKVDYREHFKSPYRPAALASKLARADIPTPLQQAQELVDSGNLSNAAALLEQAIAAQPQDGSLHFARGLLYERCGEPARAIEFFEKALRLAPENTTFLKFLARRYHETCGKSVEALGLLRQSFEKDSDDPSIHQLIGEILHTLGRVEEARYFRETAERLICEGRRQCDPMDPTRELRFYYPKAQMAV